MNVTGGSGKKKNEVRKNSFDLGSVYSITTLQCT